MPNWSVSFLSVWVVANRLVPAFGSGKKDSKFCETGLNCSDGTWLFGYGALAKTLKSWCSGLLQKPCVKPSEQSSEKSPARSFTDGTVVSADTPCRLRKPS